MFDLYYALVSFCFETNNILFSKFGINKPFNNYFYFWYKY